MQLTNYFMAESGMALPLTLIFTAAFTVLGLGVLTMSSDEMKLVANFEHGLRAFYYAEGAASEAVAGYRSTGNKGPYAYRPAMAAGQIAAVAEVEDDGCTIRATGRSGDVVKHVEMKMQVQNGVLIFDQWNDYGLYGLAPRL